MILIPNTPDDLLPTGKRTIPDRESPCNLCVRKKKEYCSRWRECQPYLDWYDKTVEMVRKKLNWKPDMEVTL